MSKAVIAKALDEWNNLEHVCNYLVRVHNITIDAKGKRKRPSKQQLKERIYQMENMSTVLCDLQRMKQLTMSRGVKRRTLGQNRAMQSVLKMQERTLSKDEDGEEDGDEDGDEDDNVMERLKAELALRGKTYNGTSYPLLVKRLLNSLRDEANE